MSTLPHRGLMARAVRSLILRTVGEAGVSRMLDSAARLFDVDLVRTAYRANGIMNFEDEFVSGEHFLLHDVLPRAISSPEPVFLDIGANTGGYSRALRAAFPGAVIHAFEPVEATYRALQESLTELRVHCHAMGVGRAVGTADVFTYAAEGASEHASVFAEVLSELHGAEDISKETFRMTTVDAFCGEHAIERVHFMKVDTEGNELAVLEGARGALGEGRIDIIQFEFNEMNVISRTFLRDFYEVLAGYRIYRLMPRQLLPLGSYNARNEIFAFQNLLAVRGGVASLGPE